MTNTNHLQNKGSNSGSGNFNATTVISAKDIDKKLLNLMKSMGN